VVCVVLVASVDHVRRLLSVRPLRYLGRISYGLYLWDGVLTAAPGMTHALQWLAVPLAMLSTHLVEEPLRTRLAGSAARAAHPDLGDRSAYAST
jgi:peptidoglycan/LPS O-acetylase OafA/YrhL